LQEEADKEWESETYLFFNIVLEQIEAFLIEQKEYEESQPVDADMDDEAY